MSDTCHFNEARKAFHAALLETILKTDKKGVPSNADKHNKRSVGIAQGIAAMLGSYAKGARLAGQMSGNRFEGLVAGFVEETFLKLSHLRPGTWEIQKIANKGRLAIAKFDQYAHLIALDRASKKDPELAAALGSDYTITPDVIISRIPEDDSLINTPNALVDEDCSRYTSLRKKNNERPILHASISCKWTIRSDRVQNARSEALNLMRNRKGRLPHIAVVTGEPLPSRIAAIALGTGDIDCVYHFALPELVQTVKELDMGDAEDLLKTMIDGKRLRDIADLPLDLAI